MTDVGARLDLMRTLAVALLTGGLGLLIGVELTARRWRADYRRLQQLCSRLLSARVGTDAERQRGLRS